MNTKRITTEIAQAADAIRAGQLVAVPTETVYGLAGNGLDPAAVAQIYEIKGRPAVKPLSLMVHDASAMARYCADVPPAAYTLAEAFWPGPLTIVLRAQDCVPEIVRAGGQTVGLRCPDHPATLALIEAAQLPLAAPSANPSGAPSPKTADDVLAYFDGQIAAVIDGGPCGIGRESTLVDLSHTPYRILRSAADTSADKNVCAVFFEKACQCSVSAFGSRHDFRTRYLAVSDIIELKKPGVTKMLEYLSVIKCYRNSHNTISFRFYLGAALSPGAAAAFAAAAKHIASARNRKRSAVDDTFRYLFTGNVVNFRSSSA